MIRRIARLVRAVMSAAVIVGLTTLTSGQAIASDVRCGDVLTQDTTLDSDLNCTGNGLVINATNITLDLHGHTITGNASSGGGSTSGITVPFEGGGATVRHGTIRNFSTGVALNGTNFVTLLGLTVSGNVDYGIFINHSRDNRLHGNITFNNGGSDIFSSGIFIGSGIYILHSERNQVERNTAFHNRNGIFLELLSFAGFGLGNSLVENEASHNASFGIGVANGKQTLLLRNRAHNNGEDGINVSTDVSDPQTTLTQNSANHNRKLGIRAVPGVADGGGNTASGNGDPLQCSNVTCTSQ